MSGTKQTICEAKQTADIGILAGGFAGFALLAILFILLIKKIKTAHA